MLMCCRRSFLLVMSLGIFALLTSLLAVTQAAHVIVPPIPVSGRLPAIRYNPSNHASPGKVTYEAFLNLICPDIDAAWPVIKQVEAYYGSDISVIVHPFSLAYHVWSHLVNEVRKIDSQN